MKALHSLGRRLRLSIILQLCLAALAVPAFGQADTLGLPIERADVRLRKTASDETPAESAFLSFTITLQNVGPDSATGVSVVDSIPTGLSIDSWATTQGAYNPDSGRWLVGDLGKADSALLVLNTIVDPGTAGSTITNVARVTDLDQVDNRPANGVDSVSVQVQVPSSDPDIAVTKVVTDTLAAPGDTLRFFVIATNLGPEIAGAIQVTDQLPGGLSYVTSATNQGSYDPGTGVWNLGTMPVAPRWLTIDAIVDSSAIGSVVTNTAALTQSAVSDPNPTNDADSVTVYVPGADLEIHKFTSHPTPNEGQPLSWTVRVENLGPDTVSAVTVTDSLPSGVTHVRDGASQGGWDPVSGIWAVGTLAPGDTASLVIDTTVDPATAGRTITNRATITAASLPDPQPANGADSAGVVPKPPPAIEVRSVHGPATLSEGQTGVSISILLENLGVDAVSVDSLALSFTRNIPGDLDADFVVVPDPANAESLAAQSTAAFDVLVDLGPGATAGVVAVDARAFATDANSGVAVQDLGADTTLAFTIEIPPDLDDDPGTLSPLAVEQGSGGNVLTIDVSNGGEADITLDGGSRLRIAAVGDTLDVPLDTGNPLRSIPLQFGPFTVPVSFPEGSHAVLLDLTGTDSNGATYQQIIAVQDAMVVAAGGVTLAAVQPVAVASPGDPDVELFTLAIAQSESTPLTLNELHFANTTVGPGNRADLDAELGVLSLWQDDGDGNFDPRLDRHVSDTAAASGLVSFLAIDLTVPPLVLAAVHITCAPSLAARDGDVLDLAIPSAASVVFERPVTFFSSWPLAPAGGIGLDGMVAAQIASAAVPPGLLFADSSGFLALDVVLPANGYEADTLERLRIVNLEDAEAGTDVEAVTVWADGGDDSFGGDDLLVGEAVWNGAQWELAGLGMPITPGGRRLFATVSLAPAATPGTKVRLAIDRDGLEMASDDDGPFDAPVPCPTTRTIRGALSEIVVLPVPQSGAMLLPGEGDLDVFAFRLVNTGVVAESLTAFTVHNTAVGPGTQNELDASWLPFEVDSVIDAQPSTLRSVSFTAGVASFAGLDLELAPGDTVTVTLLSGASVTARDGDTLDLLLPDVSALSFARLVGTTGAWPLDPTGAFSVNGMSANQMSFAGGAPTLFTGSVRNLAFEFTLPPNGYEADALEWLNVTNEAVVLPAQAGTDIQTLEAWVDDDDGTFDPAADTRLGELVFTGARWELSGLGLAIPLAGQRIFVSADIASDAVEGRFLRLGLPSLPDVGVGMQSSNDGPIDGVAVSPQAQTISTIDRVTVTTDSISPGVVAPGATGIPLVHLNVSSSYAVPKILTGVTVTNSTQGTGSQSELDAEAALLELRVDTQNGAVLATSQFVAGQADFVVTPGAWSIDPDDARELWITGDVSLLGATDGDVLGATISAPTSVEFSDDTTVLGSFPLDSGAGWTIDGMLAAQVTNHGAPVATIGPGEGPVLALDVTIPSNGYVPDILQGLSVEVGGANAADTSDLAELRLWRDADGDDAFDPGADTDLGSLTFLSGQWTSASLSEPVPAGGVHLFVSMSSSPMLADSADVQLRIPVGQITMDSANDGPRDVPVENPNVLKLSNAALLATLTLEPSAVNLTGTVTARMTVENRGDSTITAITPSALTEGGIGDLTVLSGPQPASFDLGSGQSLEFTWTCRADGAGNVRVDGRASGQEQGSGLTRQSLLATSNEVEIFLPAVDVELFPVESMPFSINRGQTDVVPLSLTLTHDGSPGTSAVRVRRLEVRLEEDLGADVVPADLLSRVTVTEGTRQYLEKDSTELETSGATMDLTLDEEVVIEAGGQATLSLSLDVSDSTFVPDFRIVILADSSLEAFDATSGAPVAIQLAPTETYPVQSGLARIAAAATQFDVAADPSATDTAVGRGQSDVTLLGLDVLNPGPAGLGADVRVSAFDVRLTDGTGAVVQNPAAVLDTIRVTSGSLTHLVTGVANGSTITLGLSPPVTVPADTPMRLTVSGDVASASTLGAYRLRLGDAAQLDVRDANTSAAVPALYATDPVEGAIVTVQALADTVAASGASMFPAAMAVGSLDVPALTIGLAHPGGPETSSIRCDSLTVQCRDGANLPLVPAAYLDAVRVFAGSVEVGTLGGLPLSGGEFTVPLTGVLIPPGGAVPLEVRCDIEVTATPTLIALTMVASGVHARDDNLGTPARVGPAAGAEFPLTSGIAQLQTPARELRAGFENVMPAVIAADGRRLPVATLTLDNSSGGTAGDIVVDHLVLQAADRDLLAMAIGDAASAVHASVGGQVWAELTGLVPGTFTARLDAALPLVISPGDPAEIEIEVTMREESDATSFRVGVAQDGVGVVQPASPLLSVTVLPEEGTFPFWTRSGTLSGESLATSWSNFPNPFGAGREATTFTFYLQDAGRVSLRLWSSRGDRVLTILEDAPLGAGLHQNRTWDGRNGNGDVVRNGVYVAELIVDWDTGGSDRVLRKVAVVR